jgi:hypothetical protein
MNMKEHILAAVKEQFDCWEEVLTNLSVEQIIAPLQPSVLSIKDEIAHLWAWQQLSIVRLHAARFQREPVFPEWLPGVNPEGEGNTDVTNAWIYEAYRHQSWSQVHQNWQAGYLHFVELGNEIPEKNLLDTDKYPWLEGYSLALVLLGSYTHHQEHLDKLVARL